MAEQNPTAGRVARAMVNSALASKAGSNGINQVMRRNRARNRDLSAPRHKTRLNIDLPLGPFDELA
jgi:hypothetical protein